MLYVPLVRAPPPPTRVSSFPLSNRRKHLLGRKWFECAECHAETEDHPLLRRNELTFACKKCKKVFRKDANDFDESDEYCPFCDNHFVLDALTPKPRLEVEGEDVRKDSRMLKDDRVKTDDQQTIWDVKNIDDKLG